MPISSITKVRFCQALPKKYPAIPKANILANSPIVAYKKNFLEGIRDKPLKILTNGPSWPIKRVIKIVGPEFLSINFSKAANFSETIILRKPIFSKNSLPYMRAIIKPVTSPKILPINETKITKYILKYPCPAKAPVASIVVSEGKGNNTDAK